MIFRGGCVRSMGKSDIVVEILCRHCEHRAMEIDVGLDLLISREAALMSLLHQLDEQLRLLHLDEPAEACEPCGELAEACGFHADEHAAVGQPPTLLARVQHPLRRDVSD